MDPEVLPVSNCIQKVCYHSQETWGIFSCDFIIYFSVGDDFEDVDNEDDMDELGENDGVSIIY